MSETTERKVWRRVTCREPLLVRADALGNDYEKAAVNRPYGDAPCDGGVYVIDIHGPLEHHEHVYFASFENVSRITCKALERSDVNAVIWRIDSPGGVANGMGAASRELRMHADKLNKKIYAYADEQICSAAYGLACAADEIWGPPTSEIGSVGVILPIVDQTRANEEAGLTVELLVTGERKGDGHPDKPLDDATREALQARVDAIGEDFFELVSEARGMSVGAVRALQAGVFMGADAVDVGLADGVALWSEFLELVKEANKTTTKPRVDTSRQNASTVTKPKGLTMARTKSLAMARAKAALAEAATIADPLARAKAVEAAAEELTKLAARMYKKTIKVEEYDSEDDEKKKDAEDDDEKKEDAEDKDDDEPESQRAVDPHKVEDEKGEEESEEEVEGAEEESEDEESEDEKMEDDEKKARKAKKAASVVGLVRALTGTRDKAAQLGRLDAMAEKAKLYDSIAQDVAKMKASERSQRVDALIKRAIDERKISPSNKRQIEFLRAQGMESPKRLAAYVEAMPRIVQRTTDEGPMSPTADAASAQLTAQAKAVIEQVARASGISIEKATAEYMTAFNRANSR